MPIPGGETEHRKEGPGQAGPDLAQQTSGPCPTQRRPHLATGSLSGQLCSRLWLFLASLTPRSVLQPGHPPDTPGACCGDSAFATPLASHFPSTSWWRLLCAHRASVTPGLPGVSTHWAFMDSGCSDPMPGQLDSGRPVTEELLRKRSLCLRERAQASSQVLGCPHLP